MIPKIDTVIIENVTPEIDAGQYPVQRIVGDIFEVQADIFTHGYEVIRAVLMHRTKDANKWHETEMVHFDNDRWRGEFLLEQNTTYQYTIFAWRDPFLSWAQELEKKIKAKVEIVSELKEGKLFIENVIPKANKSDKKRLMDISRLIDATFAKWKNLEELLDDPTTSLVHGDSIKEIMNKYADRSDCGQYAKILEVIVTRPQARFASWYEMWPRSQGTIEGKSATFADMEKRLSEIHEMGFSVVYLPPIHPIGRTNRKGPNNSLECPKGSPGCPYAIGNEQGGHYSIEPQLGNLKDFRRFEKACRSLRMEIALDLALQTSPDHPWVKDHPQWFKKRPDGSIKFAENPPKKYEDTYPLNFNTEDKEGLWNEILKVVRFWMEQGVRIFRVDNPHTKPILFWKWLLEQVRQTDPDVIFLSEAFTRPKIMKALAKAGFTQSYTYFTWRNYKKELIDYFTELTQTNVADYLIGNLFTNTPDILPEVLQNAPRSAFKMRATLAATLSSVWGMYNGFELCEGTPIPGKEEYINSEKYEYKVWDWNRNGNIKKYIGQLNKIRKEQPALQLYSNLKFYKADNENILFYGKATKDLSNIILVAVNLDPHHTHDSFVYVPIWEFNIPQNSTYQVHDLITDKTYTWQAERNYVRLDPTEQSAHIFRVVR